MDKQFLDYLEDLDQPDLEYELVQAAKDDDSETHDAITTIMYEKGWSLGK